MNINKQHINKRIYQKPAIEEVEIDQGIIYMMGSPDGEDDGGNETGDDDDWGNPDPAPDYGSQKYKSATSPFGGSRPAY